MTRPSPANELRLRAWRWLLVVAVLVGTGLWQGGHCADAIRAAKHADSFAAVSVAGDHGGHASEVTWPSSVAVDSGEPSGQVPAAPVAEGCHLLPAAAANAPAGAALALPASGGFVPRAPRRPPVPMAAPACVTALIQIGVSRT